MRVFLAFSEDQAIVKGLTPQQHQALLAIRAAPKSEATIGYVAERLLLRPHSASGLISRLERTGMLRRKPSETDQRQILLALTKKSTRILSELSGTHREELRRLRPMLTALLDELK